MCDRYRHAQEMKSAAERYYTNMTASVADKKMLNTWEREMVNAELRRRENPAGMDILAARQSAGSSHEPPTTAPFWTEMEEVIILALAIEEKQCVIYLQVLYFVGRLHAAD